MDPISIRAYKNDYKKPGDKSPDYKGRYNGIEIAMWWNEDGGYFGVKVQDDTRGESGGARRSAPAQASDQYGGVSEDDLPF